MRAVVLVMLMVHVVALLYLFKSSYQTPPDIVSHTPGGIPRIIIKTSHYKRSEIPRIV